MRVDCRRSKLTLCVEGYRPRSALLPSPSCAAQLDDSCSRSATTHSEGPYVAHAPHTVSHLLTTWGCQKPTHESFLAELPYKSRLEGFSLRDLFDCQHTAAPLAHRHQPTAAAFSQLPPALRPSMATRCQFESSSEVGVFAQLTNAYCLVATGRSENFYGYHARFQRKLDF